MSHQRWLGVALFRRKTTPWSEPPPVPDVKKIFSEGLCPWVKPKAKRVKGELPGHNETLC